MGGRGLGCRRGTPEGTFNITKVNSNSVEMYHNSHQNEYRPDARCCSPNSTVFSTHSNHNRQISLSLSLSHMSHDLPHHDDGQYPHFQAMAFSSSLSLTS